MTSLAPSPPQPADAPPRALPTWLAPSLAATTALVLALAGLTRRPLWLDEAFSLGATAQLGATVRGTAGTMASYYALLTGWTQVAGSSVSALRLLSALLMAAAVAVAVAVARRCLARHEVLIAVVGLALFPILTRYGQEARSYALVTLVTAASWLALVRAVGLTEEGEAGRARRWWLALVVLGVLGETGHGLYAIQVLVQGASLLLLPDPRRHLRRYAPTAAAVVGVAAVLARMGAAGVADWVPPLSPAQVRGYLGEVGGPGLAAIPVLALVGVGTVTLLRRRCADPLTRWRTVVPVLWGIVPTLVLLLLSLARPYLVARYAVPSVPGLVMVAAAGVAELDRRGWQRIASGRPWARPRLWGPAAVLFVGALLAGQIELSQDEGHRWDRAAAQVAEGTRSGDGLLFPVAIQRAPFEAAWRDLDARPAEGPVPLLSGRPLGEVRRVEDARVPDLLAQVVGDVSRLWIVYAPSQAEGHTDLDALLAWPPVQGDFHVTARYGEPGEIQVLLLSRS